MIDVTFLLIIFFLVSSHLGKQENNVRLELPIGQTGNDPSLTSTKVTTTIQILPNGVPQIGTRSVKPDELLAMLVAKHAETPGGLRIRIRTDRNVPYSEVAKVLSVCAKAGIADLVFSIHQVPRP